jgi:hypothetical protein
VPKVEELVGCQQPQIVRWPVGVASSTTAEEFIELADAYPHPNIALGEAQRFALTVGCSENDSGGWAARTFGDCKPRQQGKNNDSTVRELGGIVLVGERLQIHTAQALDTAKEAQRRLVEVLESYSDLTRMVSKVRHANDERSIEFRSGARIVFKTRTKSGLRGFAKVDLVVIDEAQEATSDEMAASAPVILANPNAQTWWSGSGGLDYSTEWWRLRKRALLGPDGAFGYVEHTAEQVSVVDGKIECVPPVDILDRRVWAVAMPLLNAGPVTVAAVESLHLQLGDEKFTREGLNVWDPLPDDLEEQDVKLPAEKWAATMTMNPPTQEPGRITIGWEVAHGGECASIGIGVGDIRKPYVELIEHRDGTGWLPKRLVELAREWNPTAIGCISAGPSGAQVGAVMTAFREASLPDELLELLSMSEYRSACEGFYVDVTEGRLSRPDGELAAQGPLENAVGDATDRMYGTSGWVFSQRDASIPITPLVAVTIARFLLPTEVDETPPALSQLF